MNFYLFYISRMLGLAAGMLLILGVLMVGSYIRERRMIARYLQLGAQVADPQSSRTDWVLFPPQPFLQATYKGREFRYWTFKRTRSHITLKCQPREAFENTHRAPNYKVPLWPGWQCIYAFTSPVPMSRRSIDRRPLGFGREPGLDVDRDKIDPLNATALRADLERLYAYCSAS